MVRRLQRQLPFLRSVLREADQNVRRERLQHANADQVNAISELVMNTLKGNVAVPVATALGEGGARATCVAEILKGSLHNDQNV